MRLFQPLNPPLPAWRDARVWVIGASTGIGAATAQRLLAAGARVALSARSADKLQELAGDNPRARVLPLDFTDHAAIGRALDAVKSAWGGVDLVLVVAGTHREMRAWELTDEATRALFDVNVHGPVATVAVVVPTLLAQGHGAIGIVASVAGYSGLPKAVIYGASKAAMINFTETLFLDLRPKNIGVYLINPGFVETPLTAGNDFTMPHLITADAAARSLAEGLRAGDFEIHFPHAFTRQLKFLRLLPYRLYFALVHRSTGL